MISELKTVSVYLHSVVLVGSLATGSYTGDSGSDIDLIHILNDDAPLEARALVLRKIEQSEEDTNHSQFTWTLKCIEILVIICYTINWYDDVSCQLIEKNGAVQK